MKMGFAFLAALSFSAPAFGQSADSNAGYALFDMNLSTFDLSRGEANDSDFDNQSVKLPNGQAQVRYGSFIGEIQGSFSTAVDADDDEENSASFGMIGHYAHPVGSGEAALSFGVLGGTNVEESDGSWYSLIGAGYAQDGWMVGVGRMGHLGGQSTDNSLVNFNYVQAAYSYDLSERTSLYASGYYGQGKTEQDPTVTGYKIDFGVEHALTDQMSVSASLGRFKLGSDAGASSNADGYAVNVGLKIAIGGPAKKAKNAVRFDTPDLHREITWCDEASS